MKRFAGFIFYRYPGVDPTGWSVWYKSKFYIAKFGNPKYINKNLGKRWSVMIGKKLYKF